MIDRCIINTHRKGFFFKLKNRNISIRPKKKNHNFVKSCNIRLCMFPIVNFYIFIEFYFIFYFLWETWIKNNNFFFFKCKRKWLEIYGVLYCRTTFPLSYVKQYLRHILHHNINIGSTLIFPPSSCDRRISLTKVWILNIFKMKKIILKFNGNRWSVVLRIR